MWSVSTSCLPNDALRSTASMVAASIPAFTARARPSWSTMRVDIEIALWTSFATVPRADGPNVRHRRADRVEHWPNSLEDLAVAAGHHRQRARLGPLRPAAHGRVDHVRSGRLDALRHRADDGGGAGGQVHVDRAAPQPLGKPAVADRDLLDLRRARQRRQHDIAHASDIGGRFSPAGAALAQLRRRGRLNVVHHERMAGLYELRGHAPAHSAQADESDAQRIVLSPLPSLPAM